MKEIAIIIPALNEEKTVVKVMREFHNVMPDASIWVINNFSTDSTESVARREFKNGYIRGGVINESRIGKGCALRTAFTKIDADIYVVVDADCTYPASALPELLNPVLNGDAEIVIGDRHKGGGYQGVNNRRFHGVGNALVSKIVNMIFNANVSDVLSGYRVLSKRFVKTFPVMTLGFEIETEMTIHALDKRISLIEVQVGYRERESGSVSKLNTYKDGLKVMWSILNIFREYKPMRFYGTLSSTFLLVGLILGAPVLYEFILTSYVRHVPLAILSSGVVIIAFIFAIAGLIIDAISLSSKRAFEIEFLKFQGY